MPLRPTKTLLTAACIVGASTAALPQVTGYGTILFQLVAWREEEIDSVGSALRMKRSDSFLSDTSRPGLMAVLSKELGVLCYANALVMSPANRLAAFDPSSHRQ